MHINEINKLKSQFVSQKELKEAQSVPIESIAVEQVNESDNKYQGYIDAVLDEVEKRDLHLRNVINLAAMVEKEAVFEDEMPLIAGVFQKRLDIDMPIQSDTTIQYILGEQREIITWKDTEISHPFNTYQRYGLPPGPIASPGLAAIKAALNPLKTDYLYFFATFEIII